MIIFKVLLEPLTHTHTNIDNHACIEKLKNKNKRKINKNKRGKKKSGANAQAIIVNHNGGKLRSSN